ncbi:uncharacterized protein LOC124134322 isoform X2 [Haliotis rufescens]|uniref:uncharacterized protein LOC124134322 isoform X2 n=1 Tax=Haliotis rufescens TaxID=6454 RepID=UPI001EB05988|nr:uncharacterized protein LOC124134322 isoform X2 [Haliotis rufescens]
MIQYLLPCFIHHMIQITLYNLCEFFMFHTTQLTTKCSCQMSGIVSVSGLPTTRPELGGPSTLSAVLTGPSRDPVLETLNNCNRAMLFSAMMDSDLFNSGFVSTTHRQLPEMERKVLDLAAATDVVQGVFYSIAFTQGSQMFVRYFESGCFSGIMPSMSSVLQESDSTVTQLFPYRIFTKQDLDKKVLQQKKAAASRSKSRVKQNGPTHVPNRQRYSQYFNSRYSVCKVVFDKLSMPAQSEDISNKLQVSSVIFHCVKKNADENHIRDRPLHIFGLHHPDTLLQVLKHHRIHGNHVVDDPVDFSSLKEEIKPKSVEEEFHILSSVSNYHWDNDQTANYMQYFSTYNEDTRKYPTSLRNKIIFNFRIGCQEKYTQSVKMLSAQHAQGNSEDSTHSSQTTSMQPPQKRRRIANRVRRVTPENFALSLNLSEHIVTPNVAQPSSLFDNFSTRLIEGGTILWQSHSFTKDVLIISDYCPESGKFKPQSYCKVTAS